MLFSTRTARPADAEALSDIAAETFALASPADASPKALNAYIRNNLQPEHFCLQLMSRAKKLRVLEHDGVVVGYTLVDTAAQALGIEAADRLPELSRCYVLAEHHGKGAAQRLLDDTLAQFDGAIRLTVNEQNARAIRFYQRNGFRQVGETVFVCGSERHRDWVMVRACATADAAHG
ncbi:GNAT family N-acetyltransferase [Pseudomonas sp. MAFF212428]|uniref:GNAT family N-acetyltransferase n=1 Tax=Pseudomonas brassicae TaxID=2708063 RepID=A0A6B3NV61_9PSED|nr:GNAT family N-acetyltransferase [Pseudomonas brassicae]NER59413.1 GNAT family N-acetyltransferase [Pseudomonas brassicae]NER64150.1 GNAT family N-acetyltransferase [Pseudomonas brassicae]